MSTGAKQAAGTIQAWIEETETAEAIEYGIRSIEVSRSAYGASACHSAQIIAGCQAATRVLGRFVTQGDGTLRELKAARKEQREVVRMAAECKREIGNARQLRIAMAA